MMKVKVPAKLVKYMANKGTTHLATRFHLRVLASRFSRRFTSSRLSPKVRPKGAPKSGSGSGPIAASADCDHDGVANGTDTDDDNDGLPDTIEAQIGTDPCKADTDGDGIVDGYEYRSAVDLNDDEYQHPNTALPYPGKRPYPNPLDPSDANVDYDGDGLSQAVEYKLWQYSTPNPGPTPFADVPGKATPLSYSDGMQYSISQRCNDLHSNPAQGIVADPALCSGANAHRIPVLRASSYPKWTGFLAWINAHGYGTVDIHTGSQWYSAGGRNTFSILDVDRNGSVSAAEANPIDVDGNGYLSDDERDEDGDGLSNFDEVRGRMQPAYWTSCYASEPAYLVGYAGTSPTDADSDGDGVLDGADDQDNDDVPNIDELSRWAASHDDESDDGIKGVVSGGHRPCTPDQDLQADTPVHPTDYGQVNPFNPCEPDRHSRTCQKYVTFGQVPAPFAGPNWWALQ
jgi:hypothetical protein